MKRSPVLVIQAGMLTAALGIVVMIVYLSRNNYDVMMGLGVLAATVAALIWIGSRILNDRNA